MTRSAMPALDQAEFGNNRGVEIVASSFDDKQEVARWERRLARFVRLLVFRSSPPPSTALSYLCFGDHDVAVVYRYRDDTALPGRNGSRVLISDPTVLSVPVALGLDDAFWHRLPASAHQLRADDVVSAGREGTKRLRARAIAQRDLVTKVVAALVEDPDRDLAVLECPAGDCTAVMLAVRAIADPYLNTVEGCRRSWSFSTYEIDYADGVEGTPETVFLPTRPMAQPTSRNVVSLKSEATASGEATERAHQLTQAYCDDQELDYGRFHPLTDAPFEDDVTGAYKSSTAMASQGAPRAEMSGGLRPIHGVQVHQPVPPSGPSAPPSAPQPAAPAWASSDSSNGNERGGLPPADEQRGGRQPGWDGAGNGMKDPMRRILNATDEQELLRLLNKLASEHRHAESRERLRRSLGGGRIDDVASAVALRAGTQSQKAHDLLLAALFGPEREDLDRSPVHSFAADAIRHSPFERFANRLIDAFGQRLGQYPPVVSGAIVERYLAGHGIPRGEARVSAVSPLPASRAAAPPRDKRAQLRGLAVAAGAGLLLLIIAFLLGGLLAAPKVTTPAAPPALPAVVQMGAEAAAQPTTLHSNAGLKTGEVAVVVERGEAATLKMVAECISEVPKWSCRVELPEGRSDQGYAVAAIPATVDKSTGSVPRAKVQELVVITTR